MTKSLGEDDLQWLRDHRELLTSLGEEPAVLTAVEKALTQPLTPPPPPPAVRGQRYKIEPNQWKRAVDPDSGYPYFYNISSGESKWEDTTTLELTATTQQPLPFSHEQEKSLNDNDFFEHDDDFLPLWCCCCCPEEEEDKVDNPEEKESEAERRRRPSQEEHQPFTLLDEADHTNSTTLV